MKPVWVDVPVCHDAAERAERNVCPPLAEIINICCLTFDCHCLERSEIRQSKIGNVATEWLHLDRETAAGGHGAAGVARGVGMAAPPGDRSAGLPDRRPPAQRLGQ